MRGIICSVASIAVLAACAATPAHEASAGLTASTPALVRVVAHDFAFDSSHTAPAGLVAVRLVNQGHAMHMMGIARLDSGKTVAQLYHALITNGPLGYFSELGGPGAVSPGDSTTAYMVLEPGRYSMICWVADSTSKDHFMDGMISELDITGTTAGAPVEPVPDIAVRESDYHIELSGALTAGPHIVRVDNDGPQDHDIAIVRTLPGKTTAEVLAWLNDPGKVAPAAEAVGGTVGVTRWGHTEFAVTLMPGHYVMLCEIPDRHDHRPHFMHGMVREFTI
ncbi:MAG TPA: hypothetical protein VIJ16_03775 [Gemmatimonadaceae bacterium]